jgi:hypothetical protein
MKRCSECDFIYEDDQNLCDMDGNQLVYEPTLHSLPVNATTTRPAKSRTRRLVFGIAAAVLVGALLSVGYSGLTREYAPQTTKAPPTNVIRAPQSPPIQSPVTPTTPTASPTPSPSQSPRLEKTRAKPAAGSPFVKSAPRFDSTAPGRETVRSESAKANHKKDSGIGAFFKKTGKILKKPFKS